MHLRLAALAALVFVCAAGAASPPPLVPDPRLTPGAINPAVTQATIATTICVSGYTKTIRPPASYTNKLKRQQLAARHYADQKPGDFEEDHRLELAAGGDPRSPLNLWPEPRFGTWNSLKKDKLEWFVHHAICAHRMTLKEGQAVFLSPDWRTYYTRYLGN